jgi:hypothetical protein
MGVSEQQINDLLEQAGMSIEKGVSATQSIGGQLKDQLLASTSILQDTINNILAKGGVVSQDLYNKLDEQTRMLKLKTLEAESQNTTQKLSYIIGISVVGIGILWYLSRN